MIPDECNWQIEEDEVTGGRQVWISQKGGHPIEEDVAGGVQGDNSKSSVSRVKTVGGMPMAEIDISDEGRMKEAIKQAKRRGKEASRRGSVMSKKKIRENLHTMQVF